MSSEKNRLVMRSGPNPGKAFDLSADTISIGRESTNDIVIQDSEISRNHARITRRGAGFLLEDLGSTNGTFINRQQVSSPRALVPGDEVGFGENVLLVYEGEGAAATVAAPSARGRNATRQATPPPPPPAAAPAPAPAAKQPAAAPAAPRKGPSKLLIAGCGCLVILCIAVAIGAYLFDSYNGTGLYCVSPFDSLFKMLGYCPVP
jgi:pSer/pThr/pTyr-binding forkhead associated (FHA) protein